MAGKRGQNEGSIYKRADGRWCAVVTLGYADGKRKRKSFYGKTRKEVQEALTKALRDVQQGLPIPTERLTVGAFLERWLTERVKPSVRARTYEDYESTVRVHLRPALGRIALAKLTPQDVQGMMNAKLSAKRSPLSPRTVAHVRSILIIALNQAVKWRLVAYNAAALTDPPRVERYDAHMLTPDEARALLDAVRDTRLEALYVVALTLGLRQGEVLGLRWSDIDFDAGTLTVRVQLQRGDGKGAPKQLVEPKTDRSRRTLALPAIAVDALKGHRKRQVEERLRIGAAWKDSGLVFTTATGAPIGARDLIRDFHIRRAAAQLPPIRFHDLRHATASFLLASGADMRLIMEVLGHSHIGTTANIYTHVADTVKRGAAEMMDSVLTGTK